MIGPHSPRQNSELCTNALGETTGGADGADAPLLESTPLLSVSVKDLLAAAEERKSHDASAARNREKRPDQRHAPLHTHFANPPGAFLLGAPEKKTVEHPPEKEKAIGGAQLFPFPLRFALSDYPLRSSTVPDAAHVLRGHEHQSSIADHSNATREGCGGWCAAAIRKAYAMVML